MGKVHLENIKEGYFVPKCRESIKEEDTREIGTWKCTRGREEGSRPNNIPVKLYNFELNEPQGVVGNNRAAERGQSSWVKEH